MAKISIQFTCRRCGHSWGRERLALDKMTTREVSRVQNDFVIKYRDPCPQCGAYAVVELRERRIA
jgi:ribosomal protein S27AE